MLAAILALSAISSAAERDAESLARGKVSHFTYTSGRPEAPDISFSDREGRTLSLSDFRGKVLLVNFWATWCAPCREEMPSLDRLQAALGGEDFAVVAIGQDFGGMEKVTAFLDELGTRHLAAYNEKRARAFRAFGFVGLPGSLLIDREGRQIGRLAGPAEWDSDDALRLIEAEIDRSS
jgi:thiol-disulfide isomerase/thioredoxin